jgi:hypothetical protein
VTIGKYLSVSSFGKKKPLPAAGLITDFVCFGMVATPLSTPVLAAENDLYYEENNKAY